MSSNVATPVKIAPAGQPKVTTAPGPNKNTAAAPKSAVGTGITTAPGPNANTSPAPMSASHGGHITTAPESGEKGMAERGGSTALTKSAGFAAGMAKAAAAHQAEEDTREEQAFLGALASEGVDPEVFMALMTLEERGIYVPGVTEKVAEVIEKVALNRYHILGPSAGMRGEAAPEGQKGRAALKGMGQDIKNQTVGGLVGGLGGTAAGTAIGALAGHVYAAKNGGDPRFARSVGALIGGAGGSAVGVGIGGGMGIHKSVKKTKADIAKQKSEG